LHDFIENFETGQNPSNDKERRKPVFWFLRLSRKRIQRLNSLSKSSLGYTNVIFKSKYDIHLNLHVYYLQKTKIQRNENLNVLKFAELV